MDVLYKKTAHSVMSELMMFSEVGFRSRIMNDPGYCGLDYRRLRYESADSFDIKICHIERTGTFDVNTVDTHEGIGYLLTSVDKNGIVEGLCGYID